ncbi:MAG: 30S ribosomal protein S6 [Candidatus Electrothrix sp. GW3-4]|uniref:30S ribosomal protein S6 n=1 Tax=Candidatus Electrothrix sp. GW3-4 TaxID=3126740 RepID=UPI0030D4261C
MRHYETTYILRPNLGEEQFTEIIERTNAIVQDDKGSIIDIDRWGMKRLAYEIKKETQGYYVYMSYAAPGSTIQEIERIFRIDDRVLRYLTVKLAEEIDAEGIDQEKERIAAVAAAKAAEAEELAKQNEEANDEGDKPEEKAVSEESDAPKQEQQDDAAE